MSRKGLPFFSPSARRCLPVLALLAVALLSGCDVGKGDTLRSMSISTGPINAFQCFNSQLSVIGTFRNGGQENDTQRATWTSSNPNILRVSNGDEISPAGLILGKGVVSPVAVGGPVTITASFVGLSAKVDVTVLPGKLEITPIVADIAEGTTLQLFATGILGNPGSQTILDASNVVLWDVLDANSAVITDSNLASISASGLLSTGNNGQGAQVAIPLRVKATTDITGCNSFVVTANVTVHNETLTSLTPTPSSLTVPINASTPVSVLGNFSNGFTQDLTTQSKTVYGSDTNNVGVALFGFRGKNVLTPLNQGSASMPVSFDQGLGAGSLSSNVALTVTNATLGSIAVTPQAPNMIPGTTLDFSATGTFSDNSTADMTLDVLWETDPVDLTIAAISDLIGSQGRASSPTTSNGSLSITGKVTLTDANSVATTVQGSSLLTTAGVTLDTLSIAGPNNETSGNLTVPVGQTVQMKATGNLLPSGTQDLSHQVIWSSSSENVAVVSNAGRLSGQITGKAAGNTTITARFGSVSQTFDVTVQ